MASRHRAQATRWIASGGQPTEKVQRPFDSAPPRWLMQHGYMTLPALDERDFGVLKVMVHEAVRFRRKNVQPKQVRAGLTINLRGEPRAGVCNPAQPQRWHSPSGSERVRAGMNERKM